jgi:hypothetical protein
LAGSAPEISPSASGTRAKRFFQFAPRAVR